jgi:hypothetical protein
MRQVQERNETHSFVMTGARMEKGDISSRHLHHVINLHCVIGGRLYAAGPWLLSSKHDACRCCTMHGVFCGGFCA